MEEARSLAGELSLNDPLAVRLTKKAIRRTVEIAGMRQALAEALETDIEIETTDTPESRTFKDILASDGPKAALAWRAAQRLDCKKQ
jgi:enoyl-CoA hydratase